jgi:hypothetical protein
MIMNDIETDSLHDARNTYNFFHFAEIKQKQLGLNEETEENIELLHDAI